MHAIDTLLLSLRGQGKITEVPEPAAEEKFITVIDGQRHWCPPVRHHLGHSPDILLHENGKVYCGCTCGWRSDTRTNNAMASWWNHTRRAEKERLYA